MQKWCNIIMVCKNRYVDVFINSSLLKDYIYQAPKQNYNNVYIGKDGGFNGSVCDLWYYSMPLELMKLMESLKRTKILLLLTIIMNQIELL